jgi:hypothetical protein
VVKVERSKGDADELLEGLYSLATSDSLAHAGAHLIEVDLTIAKETI